ncbi:NAD(P)/FAD-dependent oxidoreductase [Nocardioides terrisoli]|uniref:FAD-dependent oxidoreductase n=1 Tax=Nocardioides terrisoli TaxID=3388267 RepID=UPI00287B6E20|nr:FAD-dependent oxidoreductase [Nocardioides marmorisolisilvae]
MSKPTMLAVDDDPQVLASISRDLRSRYAGEYRVMRASSGAQALEVLAELALRARPVALVLSDQRMPGMSGVQMLGRAREHAPDAKFLLLTAYADTDAAIAAINEVGLDYYLQKPWDPPEEKLFPVIDDLLGDWKQGHPDDAGDVRVVGHRWSQASHELKTFLSRNYVPYQWLELERDDEARRLVDLAGAGVADLPLVIVPDAEPLRAPSILSLAEALGLRTRAEQTLYDLCIVGAGPAGLAAAVYAASEGLRAVVVEKEAPGGQAGQSASIQNYLGFPKGLSGADLAHRATAQASRFGAEMLLARDVVGIEARGPVRAVRFDRSDDIEARAVLISSGVSYRRLQGPGLEELAGRGVFYGSSASEAAQCQGDDVYIVGAANSAGQAALNFARYAKRVVILVRGRRLEDSMSMYLVAQIQATDNIEVRLGSSVVAAHGDEHLEAISIATGDESPGEAATNWLFVYIGAQPRTDWLGDDVVRDEHGFIVTGNDLLTSGTKAWPLARTPYALESSLPGVFAAGDVRLDSMKRVASAVGEGAMTVYLVHRYLAAM